MNIVRLLLCLVFALSVFAPPSSAQKSSLRVEYKGQPDRTATFTVMKKEGAAFLALTDFAQIFSMKRSDNPDREGIDLTSGTLHVSFFPNNAFAVTLNGDKKRAVVQLTGNAFPERGDLFVPLRGTLDALAALLPFHFEFDQAHATLRVGAQKTASAYDVAAVSFEEKSNGMIVHIPLAKSFTGVEHWLRPDGWLYVTVADAKGDIKSLNKTRGQGAIKKVVAIQSDGSLQLTFKVSGTVEATELMRDAETGDVSILLRKPSSATATESDAGNLQEKRDRWALDVIVLDAGHGGRDCGAIGVTGVQEKDVTLGVVQKVGALIKKNLPHVKVVYTRNSDTFVELDRRGSIANEAEGKLFISVHCNSLKKKPSPVRGFEVYLLRPGRTDEAIAIAERENSVIQMEEDYKERYKHLTDENFILTTMAQSAYVKASETFADILQTEMETDAGIPNRGVHQAGFYVLVGASMPNVLVETAYLSNRKDEKFLNSAAGQQKIAESIYRAVKRYKQEYEKLFREGKSVGENMSTPAGTASETAAYLTTRTGISSR